MMLNSRGKSFQIIVMVIEYFQDQFYDFKLTL